MPIVLIPAAWLAVLILMIAICRAAARADGASSARIPPEDGEILAGLGPAALAEPERASQEVGAAAASAPHRRFVQGRVPTGRGRGAGC